MGRFSGAMGGRQGVGAGSVYVALSFAISGVLTYAFQSISARSLGPAGYGGLAVLWSMTFLTVQVLWIGVSQTLGRYLAEREARGEDPGPVTRSVRRLQLVVLAAFLVVSLPLILPIAGAFFGGDALLAVAFVAAVAAYAAEYFRRGIFGGRRQFARLGALHVAESSSRTIIAAVLLVAGAGVAGPAVAIVLAPIIGVLAVRPTEPDAAVKGQGEPFGASRAFRFAGPVLVCVACAQVLANGGPILVALSGGPGAREGAGVLLAALILTRAPQYVMSPAIAALLPHASRTLQTEGARGLDRFVARAAGVVGGVGVLIVGGAWLFGELGMGLLYGPRFEMDQGPLVALALLATSSLLCEVLDQALFARGEARLAALSWLPGVLVAVAAALTLRTGAVGDPVSGISLALALGGVSAAAAHAILYALLAARASSP